jgi:hypothetical protein
LSAAGLEGAARSGEQRIRLPTYYRPEFTRQELETIEQHTETVAARFALWHYELDGALPPRRSATGPETLPAEPEAGGRSASEV